MKSKKAAWEALRGPVTLAQAAKLLGVSRAVVHRMVSRLDLLTIEAKGRTLIPLCELRRFRPY